MVSALSSALSRGAALALASVLACGCELIVGNDERTTAIDADASDAAEASATIDAHADALDAQAVQPDTAPPPPCGHTCVVDATACAARCVQASTSCQATCQNGACDQCSKTEQRCKDTCNHDCTSCTQAAGCSGNAGCDNATQ